MAPGEASVTKATLEPDQRRLVELVETLGFGAIEGLCIKHGLPCHEPEMRIVQSLKLDSEPELVLDRKSTELLKIEFKRLFEQLGRLREGVVDIEIRHGVPFRLV